MGLESSFIQGSAGPVWVMIWALTQRYESIYIPTMLLNPVVVNRKTLKQNLEIVILKGFFPLLLYLFLFDTYTRNV